MIDKVAIKKLQSETKIGDKFGIYYHGVTYQHTHVVTRFNEKSIWMSATWMTDKGMVTSTSRESWNTVLGYINKKVMRRE